MHSSYLPPEIFARHAVRLKVNRDKYTISEVERLFNVAFAASEAELKGAEDTVLLKMNMSIEEVITRKGKPKTRVELGSKNFPLFVLNALSNKFHA